MAVDLSQQMRLVLHINHARGGAAEVYPLKVINYPDALTVGAAIMHYRRSFLAANCEIVWARVSFYGRPKERRGVAGPPLGPLPQLANVLTCDNIRTMLHYAFESDTGRWANRYFRFVPDAMVEDMKVPGGMIQPLAAGLALSNPLDGAAPLDRIQKSFLRYLISNTRHVQVTAKGPPIMGNVEDWATALPRRVSGRKTGRPFGLSAGKG